MNIQEKIAELEFQVAELKKIAEEKEKKQEEYKLERVEEGENYYYVYLCNSLKTGISTEGIYTPFDNKLFAINNYFLTEERAEEVAEKIKMLLKLERLHDIYCPNYVPNWDCSYEEKYYVYYDCDDKFYECDYVRKCKLDDVYFPTKKIAQKVCDILNTEKERKNNDTI